MTFPRSVSLLLLLATSVSAADFHDPYNLPNRDLAVHLFEWKWTDIANECETYLSKYGYGTVQISPPNEHITIVKDNDQPWYQRYQPVSYKLTSRSGTEAELKDMIERCNKVGVRIMADVVLNHMVGSDQKYGVDSRSSSGGSFFDAKNGNELFPSVPYGKNDFNDWRCDHSIEDGDYKDKPDNVRGCRLVGLVDLNQESDYVQGKILKFLNTLISYGVSGFRFDAAKHMWPKHLKDIQYKLDFLKEDVFGKEKRPFIVHEVVDHGGESISVNEYIEVGRYTNFNFGAPISQAIRKGEDFSKLADMGDGYGYGNGNPENVFNFIDNHDNQRDDPNILSYKDGDKYKQAVAFMLAWNYGYNRVMSSYNFTSHNQGPPNLGARNGYKTKSPEFNSDLTCSRSSGYVCEHRMPEIRRMALFKSFAGDAKVAEMHTALNVLGFAREGKGYFALNNRNTDYGVFNVKTTLPAGVYCDLATGEKLNGRCTGRYFIVGANGQANLFVSNNWFMAVTLESKL